MTAAAAAAWQTRSSRPPCSDGGDSNDGGGTSLPTQSKRLYSETRAYCMSPPSPSPSPPPSPPPPSPSPSPPPPLSPPQKLTAGWRVFSAVCIALLRHQTSVRSRACARAYSLARLQRARAGSNGGGNERRHAVQPSARCRLSGDSSSHFFALTRFLLALGARSF